MLDRFFNWFAFITFTIFCLLMFSRFKWDQARKRDRQRKYRLEIEPRRRRLFASLALPAAALFVPILVILWLLTRNGFLVTGLAFLLLTLLVFFPLAYQPTFTICFDGTALERAGFRHWHQEKRLEITELDRSRTAAQHLGQRLGIVFLYSHSGERLLILGLDEEQVARLLALENELEDNHEN